MKGYLVGVSRIAEASVIVKQSVKTAKYPRMMLRNTPQKIDLGRVSEASLISSAVLGQRPYYSTGFRM